PRSVKRSCWPSSSRRTSTRLATTSSAAPDSVSQGMGGGRGIIAAMPNIDIHAHWYPAEWLKLFEKDGPKEGGKLERTPGGYRILTSKIVNAFDQRFVEVDARIGEMDKR